MDIEKAKQAARLAGIHGQITKAIKEFRVDDDKGNVGYTTITIPRTWLPAIVKIAEDELVKVEEEIARL